MKILCSESEFCAGGGGVKSSISGISRYFFVKKVFSWENPEKLFVAFLRSEFQKFKFLKFSSTTYFRPLKLKHPLLSSVKNSLIIQKILVVLALFSYQYETPFPTWSYLMQFLILKNFLKLNPYPYPNININREISWLIVTKL